MNAKEREAFESAYLNEVSCVTQEKLREFMDKYCSGKNSLSLLFEMDDCASIIDALGIWQEAIKFSEKFHN